MVIDVKTARLSIANITQDTLLGVDIHPQQKSIVFEKKVKEFLRDCCIDVGKDFTVSMLFAVSDDYFDALNHGAVFVEGYTMSTLEARLNECLAHVLNGDELVYKENDYYSRIVESRADVCSPNSVEGSS